MTASNALSRSQFHWQAPAPEPTIDNYSSRDFNADMRNFRQRRGQALPGVQEYLRRQEQGYQAHVEGLYQHARYVEHLRGRSLSQPSYGPESEPRGSTTADEKLRDYEHYYPEYRQRLEQSIRQGTVEPLHVAMGYEMAGNPRYGHAVSDRSNREGRFDIYGGEQDVWLGNGGHRLALARQLGVQRIPVQHGAAGTGDEPDWGGKRKYGQKRPPEEGELA